MSKIFKIAVFANLFFVWNSQVSAQEWVEKMNNPEVNFYEVVKAYESYFENKSYQKGQGMKQFERWRYFMEPRVYPTGERPDPYATYDALQDFKKNNKVQPNNKSANWQPLGPTSWQSYSYNPGNGRINSVRVDPNDSNRIYVGTPAGGCWKSTDGGQSWTPLSDYLPVIGVTDIAINPNNSNEIYISTGDGFSSSTYSIGVLKSSDQGQTWNTTGLNFFRSQNVRGRKLLMNPFNTQVLWVATSVGLFKTNNGGQNWTSVLSGDVRNVQMKPGDSTVVYASTDQFYRSSDGGNTFTMISSGISPANQINRMEIAVTKADSNYVYAVTGKQSDATFEGIYFSVDAGQNFFKMSSTPNIFGYSSSGSDNSGQSWYDLAIAVNQEVASEIYVGGINVWKSTSSGASWSIMSHWTYPSNIGYTHADIHALEWYNGKLYCGSDGGIYSSGNNGNSWNDLSSGLQIMQIYKMAQTEQNSNVLMAGAQDNGCNYRTSTGNWTHILGGDGMTVQIDYTNPNIVYYTWQNGGIHRSYNGGQSGTNTSNSIRSQENGAWVTPFQLDPQVPTTLYAAFENVWKTTNRGQSWNKISNFSGSNTLRNLKVAPSNSNVIYVCGNDNQIRRTTNGGSNWSIVNTGLPNRAITDIEVHPSFPDSVWVCFSGYSFNSKVFVTGDGGQTWTNHSTNMPNLPINDLAYDTVSHTLYAGTEIGVYYQRPHINLGWNAYNTGLPNVIVEELEIHYSSQKLRAATYGRGIWESDLIRPLSTGIDQSTQENLSTYQIAPNPTQNTVRVSWGNNAPLQLSLQDLTGKLLIQDNQLQGNSTQLNLADFPNGVYILTLRGAEDAQQFKLIKTE